MFVRATVKLLINCTTRYKMIVSTNSKAFTNSLYRMLDDMEAVISTSKFLNIFKNLNHCRWSLLEKMFFSVYLSHL